LKNGKLYHKGKLNNIENESFNIFYNQVFYGRGFFDKKNYGGK
jgi:hypothetical protein